LAGRDTRTVAPVSTCVVPVKLVLLLFSTSVPVPLTARSPLPARLAMTPPCSSEPVVSTSSAAVLVTTAAVPSVAPGASVSRPLLITTVPAKAFVDVT
jgi:hypothetical protein